MTDQLIDRRKAFKYLGLLAGTATGREFLAAWLPSASSPTGGGTPAGHAGMHHFAPPAEPAKAYVPQFFKPEEFETAEILTEMIIPTDDQPGAKEAQVASYIDFVVFSAAEYEPSLQKDWIKGLAWLDRTSKKKHGHSFREISPADRERLLTEMSLPEHDPHADAHQGGPGFAFYRLVKEMTVEGFYSSRVGLMDVLEYKGLTFLPEFPGCTHPEHQT